MENEAQGNDGNCRDGGQKYYSRGIGGPKYYSTGHVKVAKGYCYASKTFDVSFLNNWPSFYTIPSTIESAEDINGAEEDVSTSVKLKPSK